MTLESGDKLNVLSLFSGIEGLGTGIRIAVPGSRVVGYVEQDHYCQQVLLARMRDGSLDTAPIYGDVRTFDGKHWRGFVHLICGGFPCQDISNAGQRAGISGERSGLWSHFARLVGEIRPRYVYVENVAAILGRGMDTVLGDLSDLGYDSVWGVVSAAEVGAPHLRKRVFILAHSRCQCDREDQSLAECGCSREANACVGLQVVAHAAQQPEREPEHEACAVSRKRSRSNPGGGCQPLADAEGQRHQLRAAQGERLGRSAGGGGAVGDTPLRPGELLCGERRDPESKRTNENGHAASACRGSIDAMGNPERQGLALGGVQRGYLGEECEAPERASLPIFPPGPAERDAWRAIIERHPNLAPALEAAAKSRVRVVADELSNRLAQLKSCGNAVLPLQSALAFVVLAERLGVDL